MPRAYPHPVHITRRRGVFHYRRRLPAPLVGELLLSLRTRSYRRAEWLAERLDRRFERECRGVMSDHGDAIRRAMRAEFQAALEEDLAKRTERGAGQPAYAYWWERGSGLTAEEADLQAIRAERQTLHDHLANNWTPAHWRDDWGGGSHLDNVLATFGLPKEALPALVAALLEARLEASKVIERRTLGQERLFPGDLSAPFETGDAAGVPGDRNEAEKAKPPSRLPPTSELIEAHFHRRSSIDRATGQVLGQERGTLRRFLEVAGDKRPSEYTRADVTAFLAAMRRLPNVYGRSPKDHHRPLAEIIAEAEGKGLATLSDKTLKRHLSALSAFFQFAVDHGHLSASQRVELTSAHKFRSGKSAREQRDMWSPAELAALFRSPVWTGCHRVRRSEPGAEIIRDAKFWLPLLALFHGTRLEECADLYRRDVRLTEGVWHLSISETGGRRLKNRNAARMVPLHPTILALGFLEYVEKTAVNQDAPLFPDLLPQGPDRKRGPRITRWFVEYRRAIGLYRPGVGVHAFRHVARTRLGDAITTEQQRRHVDFLMGHASGGGEGASRYDKGPPIGALLDTLSLLSFPEIDLAHLHSTRPEPND